MQKQRAISPLGPWRLLIVHDFVGGEWKVDPNIFDERIHAVGGVGPVHGCRILVIKKTRAFQVRIKIRHDAVTVLPEGNWENDGLLHLRSLISSIPGGLTIKRAPSAMFLILPPIVFQPFPLSFVL